MFEFLYEWIRNIAFYMVVVTAVVQVLPNDTYKKYIRFFTGMILIMLLLTPVLKIFNMEQPFHALFTGASYEQKIEEIQKMTEYLNKVQLEDYVVEEEKDGIEVEEIRIGR